MTTEKGKEQAWDDKSETMMLKSDLALMNDAEFKDIVAEYAMSEPKFHADFKKAWIKL